MQYQNGILMHQKWDPPMKFRQPQNPPSTPSSRVLARDSDADGRCCASTCQASCYTTSDWNMIQNWGFCATKWISVGFGRIFGKAIMLYGHIWSMCSATQYILPNTGGEEYPWSPNRLHLRFPTDIPDMDSEGVLLDPKKAQQLNWTMVFCMWAVQ